MRLVDSHCHLDDKQFDADRDALIERALAAGVECMLSIGTGDGPPDLEAALRIAERHESVYATVGVHPEHAAKPADFDRLRELLQHPKVLALGEIGLDYYWQPFDKGEQHRVFVHQLAIAREANVPVVLHTRDAWDDTLAIVEREWDSQRLPCVLHCFGGGPEVARRAVELGCYLSFAGVVTFPKAEGVRESAKLVPLDRMLVETDAPYLAPVPHRGKRNEPAFVEHTARRLAEVCGVDPEVFGEQMVANFERVFFSRPTAA